MSEATTALLAGTEMVAATTPRQAPPARSNDAPSTTRRTSSSSDDIGSKPSPDKGLHGADGQRSFAATLDSVDAQAPTETRSVDAPTTPHAAETSNPEPQTATALNLLKLPIADANVPTGNPPQPGGNPLPETGNLSPGGIALATAQPTGQQWAAEAPADTSEIDNGLPRIEAASLRAASTNGANVSDPSLSANGRQSFAGPVPAAQLAGGEVTTDTTRSDSLRAGVLDAFSIADSGVDSSLEGGDAQSGDARRQLPDGLMRLAANERADLPSGARVTAEFSLNAAPATPPPIETGAVTARPGDMTSLDLLSGQRPLQPLGDQTQWSQGLGQRLMMMADGGVQSARIRLHPEHLGQLDVRIEIEDDTARVWFSANSSQAREAIESALPKLREMFDSNGLDLVGTDVSDDAQRFAANPDASPDGGRAGNFDADAPSANDPSAGPTIMRMSDRLVDFYA
ncbi:MAG: flagellar hook-length control protein FliK [Gammaproteobacteria bacterium]